MSASLISANIQAGLYEAVMATTDLVQLFSARGRPSITSSVAADGSEEAIGEPSLDELHDTSRRQRQQRRRRRTKGDRSGLMWSDDVQPSSLLPDEQSEWTYSMRVTVDQLSSGESDEEADEEAADGSGSESGDGFDPTEYDYSSDDGSDEVDAEYDDKLTAEQRVASP